MKLTICFDGQFYVGLIENISENKYKAYRYIFGNEPKDQEVLDFVNKDLLDFIKQHDKHDGIHIHQNQKKKINPKRLQRIVAKEMKQPSISSKAQEALKAEYELRKKEKSVSNKRLKEERRKYIREIKVQKSKNKRKGR
ncbi:YjdF family protein [Bacillus sp. REN10]|uniref:YjdF family protein n=1 Tax=Bacillus sp. REN10 TaxID=2782541 RepID=UPI001EEF21B1|nr:YjdF family protein [Bacillus sp. REN10]